MRGQGRKRETDESSEGEEEEKRCKRSAEERSWRFVCVHV